jgi:hypothetical protein
VILSLQILPISPSWFPFPSGDQEDPVLGAPAMKYLREQIRNRPPPMELVKGGHFAQECGEEIARRALEVLRYRVYEFNPTPLISSTLQMLYSDADDLSIWVLRRPILRTELDKAPEEGALRT